MAHSNCQLPLPRQVACNGMRIVHSTGCTNHHIPPKCSPHRQIIWALIMESTMSAKGQEEALQCSTNPALVVIWWVRHATRLLLCSTLRTATNLQVGGRHACVRWQGAMEANSANFHGRKAPPIACFLPMGM